MKVKCPRCDLIFESSMATRHAVQCKNKECGHRFGRYRNSIN